MTDDEKVWHAWRKDGIGGSDIAVINGTSPWSSPYHLFKIKTGQATEDPPNDRMVFGKQAEPLIVKMFVNETGLAVAGEQMWCKHKQFGHHRSTIDGLVLPDDDDPITEALGVLELKATTRPPWVDVPDHYVDQVQWQMHVTESDHAWLACLHGQELRVYELDRDDAHIAHLCRAADEFWQRVLTGDPPPLDGRTATTDTMKDIEADPEADPVEVDGELVRLVSELRVEKKDIETRLAHAENELRDALGESTVGLVDGNEAVTWRPQVSRQVDTKALGAAHPDLLKQFTKESRFRVMRLKEAGE